MTQCLPPVLSPADLPEAELRAARLDGEVFPVGECFSPVDEVVGPMHRARSLAALLPPRLIAEQHSAAWVLGASDSPPSRPELCTDSDARTRPTALALLAVREVVIDASEYSWLGGIRVTTPLRTAIDLARFSDAFGAEEREIVARLAESGRFRLGDVIEAIERRRNLPRKRIAMMRLGSVFSGTG
jgi:hypothetical protein